MDIKKISPGIPYIEAPAVEGGVDYKTEATRLKKVIASTCERFPSYEDSAALARRVRIFGEAGVRTKSLTVENHVVGALEDAMACGGDTAGVRATAYEALRKIESKPGPSPLLVSASLYIAPCY